jgi:hypothetical protein
MDLLSKYFGGQTHPNRPYVGAQRQVLELQHLGRHIVGRAENLANAAALFDDTGDAKVTQFQTICGKHEMLVQELIFRVKLTVQRLSGQQYVLRFQVQMCNLLTMHVLQRGQYILHTNSHLILAQVALLVQQCLQFATSGTENRTNSLKTIDNHKF